MCRIPDEAPRLGRNEDRVDCFNPAAAPPSSPSPRPSLLRLTPPRVMPFSRDHGARNPTCNARSSPFFSAAVRAAARAKSWSIGKRSGPVFPAPCLTSRATNSDSPRPIVFVADPAAPFPTPAAPNVTYVSGSPATSMANRVGALTYHGKPCVSLWIAGTSDNPIVRCFSCGRKMSRSDSPAPRVSPLAR